MSKNADLSEADRSAVIEMALSDHVSFANIQREYGLREKEVKALMRTSLKPAATAHGANASGLSVIVAYSTSDTCRTRH